MLSSHKGCKVITILVNQVSQLCLPKWIDNPLKFENPLNELSNLCSTFDMLWWQWFLLLLWGQNGGSVYFEKVAPCLLWEFETLLY